MTTYLKAVRPDGASFYSPSFRWLPKGWKSGNPIPEGWVVEHPGWTLTGGAAGYLSVSVSPTDCTGMYWPCVLLEVEPVGEVVTPEPEDLPNKRAGVSFRVVRELTATDALGPQGVHVAALIERSSRLTADGAQRLTIAMNAEGAVAWTAAWNAATDAAWTAAREAAWNAAWKATGLTALASADDTWDAAWDAALDAALALIVRDLITQEHYDTLTSPWRTTIGPIHPDDNDFMKD